MAVLNLTINACKHESCMFYRGQLSAIKGGCCMQLSCLGVCHMNVRSLMFLTSSFARGVPLLNMLGIDWGAFFI